MFGSSPDVILKEKVIPLLHKAAKSGAHFGEFVLNTRKIQYPEEVTMNIRHSFSEKSPVTIPIPLTPGPELLKPRTPVKLFDDLYFVGHSMCGSWIIPTSDGLVLIEASAEVDFWETTLRPGLEKLGLGGKRIIALLLTHGHMDHYAGCNHIQQDTGCDIYLSMEDTAYITSGVENIPANKGISKFDPAAQPIPMFMVTKILHNRDDLRFGDHTIHCLSAPGHTPGCMNYSMEVHEGSEAHRFVMMGGYGVFGPGCFMGDEYPYGVLYAQKQALAFAQSCVELWEYAKETNADIFLNPHPHLCDMYGLDEKNRSRGPEETNAFVIGREGVRRWIAERYYACLEAAADFTDLTQEIL